jgi:hypothetical protein
LPGIGALGRVSAGLLAANRPAMAGEFASENSKKNINQNINLI